MSQWGEVELESEIEDWFASLSYDDKTRVVFYIDLLAEKGPLLDEPYTRQLDGKLRELRFHLGQNNQRITYYIASGRRIILLTVFQKTRQQERREVARAKRAMDRCVDEGHSADEE